MRWSKPRENQKTKNRKFWRSFGFCRYVSALFPTCRVRVARFYVSCLLLVLALLLRVLLLVVVALSPPPRPYAFSVRCHTSAATIWAQCFLPDLIRDHPRPVFPARPYWSQTWNVASDCNPYHALDAHAKQWHKIACASLSYQEFP